MNHLIDELKHQLNFWRTDTTFIDWRGIGTFSQELSLWLDWAKTKIRTPQQGLALVVEFYRLDGPLMERTDDDGIIGQVFEDEAAELFWHYAGACDDREWVRTCLFTLLPKNHYGTRYKLFEQIGHHLPKSEFRTLTSRVRRAMTRAGAHSDWADAYRTLLTMAPGGRAETMAQGRVELAANNALLTQARRELQNGRPNEARQALDTISHGWRTAENQEEYRQLRFQVDDLEQIHGAWNFYDRNKTPGNFTRLLEILEPDYRDGVADYLERLFYAGKQVNLPAFEFLLRRQRATSLARWLCADQARLSAQSKNRLAQIAARLEAKAMAAVTIYRHLIERSLPKKRRIEDVKAAAFLKRIDELKAQVEDWGDHPTPEAFRAQLSQKYAGNHHFWRQYENGQNTKKA